VQHLLNHTSGLTYGFHHVHVQDEMYRNAGYEWGAPKGHTLEQAVADWARLPLRFDPGTRWNYSVATDVLGRLVEVVSGQSLDQFFQQHIFDPLGMKDTAFRVRGDLGDRLGALYVPGKDGKATRNDAFGDAVRGEITFCRAAAACCPPPPTTTASRRCCCAAASWTARACWAAAPAPHDPQHAARRAGPDPVRHPAVCRGQVRRPGLRPGLFGAAGPAAGTWGVGANTPGARSQHRLLVDPAEQITAIFMTQLLPSSTYPIRTQLRQLVYSALVD
jgi:CubicO group peptidase (beta-lactamase class C family)